MPAHRRCTFNVVHELREKTPYVRQQAPETAPHVQATVSVLVNIWEPKGPPAGRPELSKPALTAFTCEVLRRCQFSRQLLETALYYLVKLKPHVEDSADEALKCPRKMLLAALILSGKYMQDRPFSTAAWSKISGLAPASLVKNELLILKALNWDLFIPHHGLESLHLHLQTLAQLQAPPLIPSPIRVLPETVPELTDDDSS